MNISVINCTPHAIAVERRVYSNLAIFGVGPNPLTRLATRGDAVARVEVRVHLPSGIRLAAQAITSGPDFGCSVRYTPTQEAIAEMAKLKTIFAECQGSRHLVIASEISCRAMAINDRMFDGASATNIEMMWPVLAAASLRLPMAERWADKLATLPPAPVRNITQSAGNGGVNVAGSVNAPIITGGRR